MNADAAHKHTALIEQEDALLDQLDTYHQVAAALWRFLEKTEEPYHVPTVRQLIAALRSVERDINDQLLDVRLELLVFRKNMKAH